jgi:hypothetical protein
MSEFWFHVYSQCCCLLWPFCGGGRKYDDDDQGRCVMGKYDIRSMPPKTSLRWVEQLYFIVYCWIYYYLQVRFPIGIPCMVY